MGFLIGQSVNFETQAGIKGSGVIVQCGSGTAIVHYTYEIEKGPFAGNRATCSILCLESEMVRSEDYRLQVEGEGGTWTLAAKFHEKDARSWIEIIRKFTGERAIMVPVEWV